MQVRALDFDMTASLQDAPTVVVYHPDEGNVFANVGWAGWIASISGEDAVTKQCHLTMTQHLDVL